MKQPNDDQTTDMLPGGAPVYDLDPEMPWPMPAGGKWKPRPAADDEQYCGTSASGMPSYMAEQERRNREMEEHYVRAMHHDPAEERNPIAAAFTRLMTWSRR